MAPGCKYSVALKPPERKLRECAKRKEENIGAGPWIPLLAFGGNKRGLLGVIKQRCLCGEVSVSIASEGQTLGMFLCNPTSGNCQHCSPGAGSSGYNQGDAVISGMIKGL